MIMCSTPCTQIVVNYDHVLCTGTAIPMHVWDLPSPEALVSAIMSIQTNLPHNTIKLSVICMFHWQGSYPIYHGREGMGMVGTDSVQSNHSGLEKKTVIPIFPQKGEKMKIKFKEVTLF